MALRVRENALLEAFGRSLAACKRKDLLDRTRSLFKAVWRFDRWLECDPRNLVRWPA